MASESSQSTITGSSCQGYGTFKNYREAQPPQLDPFPTASFWSRLTFGWVNPLMAKAAQRPLEKEDLWIQHETNKASRCRAQLSRSFESCGQDASLLCFLMHAFRFEYAMVGLIHLCRSAASLLTPYWLNRIVETLSAPELNPSLALSLLGGMVVSQALQSVFDNQAEYRTIVLRMRMNSALQSFVFCKTTRLTATTRRQKSVGEIVNLLTIDVRGFISGLLSSYYCLTMPIEIAVATYMLCWTLGLAAVPGVLCLMCLLAASSKIVVAIGESFQSSRDLGDELMNAVSELFSSISIVKFNAWEEKYGAKVMDLRREEQKVDRQCELYESMGSFLAEMSPFLASSFTFAIYSLFLGQEMTAAKVFTSLALFRLLQKPIADISDHAVELMHTKVSYQRVSSYLSLPEQQSQNILGPRQCPTAPSRLAVGLYDGHFSWSDEENEAPVLNSVNLAIEKGSLVLVTGKVGAGKSSLCSILLGDLVTRRGAVYVDGRIAYCCQEPWIQNLTVRENILFGRPYCRSTYRAIIKACALEQDIGELEDGDQTEIGENGAGLSGGQKARVALARAVYSNADIFILDCPFAAVDAEVANQIFAECIVGLLRGKTVLLCTHNSVLVEHPAVDMVLQVEEGKVLVQSTREGLNPQMDLSSVLSPFPSCPPFVGLSSSSSHANAGFECTKGQFHHAQDRNHAYMAVRVEEGTEAISPRHIEEKCIPELERRLSLQRLHSFSPLAQQMSAEMIVSPHTSPRVDESKRPGRMDKEERIMGSAGWRPIKIYLRAAGGLPTLLLLLLAQMLISLLTLGSNVWLSHWTAQSSATQALHTAYYLGVYVLIGLISNALLALDAVVAFSYGIRASTVLFQDMLFSLLRVPLSFFDANPLGRIVTRIGRDVSDLDAFPILIGRVLSSCFSLAGNVVLNLVISPLLLLVVLPIAYLSALLGHYRIKADQELERLYGLDRSPIISFLSSTIAGLPTVRAFGKGQVQGFIHHHEELLDSGRRSYYGMVASTFWFATRAEALAVLYLFAVSLTLFLGHGFFTPATIALSLSCALALSSDLIRFVTGWAALQKRLVAPERIQQYIDLEPEAPHHLPERDLSPSLLSWPSKGRIVFDNVSFTYRTSLPLVLKGLSFEVKAGEKIGVVGRTGAGKTTIIMSLFRINELSGGKILIDGVDISSLGLHALRSRLSFIPQTPVLFEGTLRNYLDPFGDYSDEKIWAALSRVGLEGKFRGDGANNGLETAVAGGGDNFSVGEKQLLVMARILMKNSKIVLMDEATASMDLESDQRIQQLIREGFRDSTVVTIAHRLNTIIDYDRVIVMEAGEIKELDSPQRLLDQRSGIFYRMAQEAGLAT